MKPRALICGISGQLGSHLADLLLEKGYAVTGLVRRVSSDRLDRIRHLESQIELLPADLTDQASLERVLAHTNPQEVYNCAAQSQVGISFAEPLHTSDVTGLGALRLFEAIRTTGLKGARVYQSSSSEMFGSSPAPQSEQTPFAPRSPYACAKTFAHYCAQVYRQAYGLFIACGINFNFEGERRSSEFVTRKITQGVGRIQRGEATVLRLGNLLAQRDWSHAEDVARAAWLMLQHPTPEDFVIATGVTHSVQEFADLAFSLAGLNSSDHIVVDPQELRPLDVHYLRGDATKAHRLLGWQPTVAFPELVRRMVAHDAHLARDR